MSQSAPPTAASDARITNASSLALWIGGAGAILLAAGTWFASRALLRLGPVALVAVTAAALGAGLVIAAALLSVLAPAHVADDANTIARTLDAVARGDLARDAEAVRADSPVHTIGGALRRALAFLRPALGSARGAAKEAAQRAEELGAQCSSAHVAAQRFAEQGAHVAEQASVAAEQAADIHAEFARLGSGVTHLEAELRARADHSARIAGYTSSTAANLNEATTGLDDLMVRFTAATTELASLGRSVEDVQEFVALVRKMARQSKLLSLNAAMEAARAGEQGSGFGVVAAEVRRLAKSSSEAADRTERLLRDLFARADQAQESSRETLGLARTTREAVERSRVGITELRQDLGPALPARDAAWSAPAAAILSTAARLEQLSTELTSLAQAAKDTRLAGSAQVARVQDLIAASHSLGRSAARAAQALQDLKLDATVPAEAPAARSAPPRAPLPAT